MATEADLSRLEKFFSAYFNEDWDYDAENPEGVVRQFKAGATLEERAMLAAARSRSAVKRARSEQLKR